MKTTQDRHHSEPLRFLRLRFRAAVELRGLSMEGLARACEVSVRHLFFVVNGQRIPSAELAGKIRSQIGDPGWDFATGQTDSLRDLGSAHV